jgi:threonine synthase
MGLPIEKLVVATNENDVLDVFFKTGVYQVRTSEQTHETSSPSMDISKASNFERFILDLFQGNAARVKQLFQDELGQTGRFDIGQDPLFWQAQSRFGFYSGRSTHADRLRTIQDTHKRFSQIIDTHTADGLKVAREHLQPDVPMVVLETALPIKFADTITEALGHAPPCPPAFADLPQRPQRVTVMPADVAQVKAFIQQHSSEAV